MNPVDDRVKGGQRSSRSKILFFFYSSRVDLGGIQIEKQVGGRRNSSPDLSVYIPFGRAESLGGAGSFGEVMRPIAPLLVRRRSVWIEVKGRVIAMNSG